MAPTMGNGKICYIEMPSKDVKKSADFYQKVFGWNVRTRGNGAVAFDDGVGEVSGTWVLGRAPFEGTGLTIHIMVDDIEVSMKAVKENGGEIVRGVGEHAPEITAKFRDPTGNVFGLYQERGGN
jgi:predicted enzyme related to lactoylglutathione lyase